jgi:di/tricarboxylate transporter
VALGIAAGFIVISVAQWLPIVVAALLCVVLMVLTGCLRPGEIYGAIRWDVIFLLAGLLPLGIAMDKSGTNQWLAEQLLEIGTHLPPYGVLVLFYIATAVLTEMLSNNASAVLMIPIAVKVAESLALSPMAAILTVTFAASNSYMTPIGYQTNMMVYSPGGYKFLDFMRVGAPLSLTLAFVTPLLILQKYG